MDKFQTIVNYRVDQFKNNIPRQCDFCKHTYKQTWFKEVGCEVASVIRINFGTGDMAICRNCFGKIFGVDEE